MNRSLPAAAVLWLAGCGYVGEPLPPLANVPANVTDLAAVQRGGLIIVQFSVPAKTTEGNPIPKPVRLDLRGGTAEHFEPNQWAAAARQFPPGTVANGIARYEIPSAGWTGKEVIFGVRAEGGNGKHSLWSNFVIVPVVAAPEKPTALTTAANAQGVRLTWQGRGSEFRVLRKAADSAWALSATVTAPEWLDTSTEFDKTYTYMVQAVLKLDNHKEAESELSAEASIVPRDTFPPAAPKGVQASIAPNSIELNWEPNAEEDLNGYRIYRAEGNGEMAKIADVAVVPAYSDRKAEHGKTYRYTIAAVDRAGNESPRSAVVEAAMP